MTFHALTDTGTYTQEIIIAKIHCVYCVPMTAYLQWLFTSQDNPVRRFLFLFCRWGDWGPEWLSNLPQIMHLESDKTRLRMGVVWALTPSGLSKISIITCGRGLAGNLFCPSSFWLSFVHSWFLEGTWPWGFPAAIQLFPGQQEEVGRQLRKRGEQ